MSDESPCWENTSHPLPERSPFDQVLILGWYFWCCAFLPPRRGELGKSLARTAARSSRATAIEGLGAETTRVLSSATQFQSHLTPFASDRQASGCAIQSP